MSKANKNPQDFNPDGFEVVKIPACVTHEGTQSTWLKLKWVCPRCGAARGDPRWGVSFDGSRKLKVHQWENPCGHIDWYSDVRLEQSYPRL